MQVKPTIVVWFSCGAASAVAAKLTLDKYKDSHNVRIVNNPIKQEHPDNRRFLKDVQNWLGVQIETATNKKHPDGDCAAVWEAASFMNSIQGAKCTTVLKKEARQQWEDANLRGVCYSIVLGFTFEERQRHENFILTERSNVLPVLIEAGLTKQDCLQYCVDAGLKLPKMYELGFPNANCIGCVKATSPTYWNHVRKHFPDEFRERAVQSRRIGCRLVRVKGRRIFLDELKETDLGRPLKSLVMPDCSIFCEEFSTPGIPRA